MQLSPGVKAALLVAVALFAAYMILDTFNTTGNIKESQQFVARFVATRRKDIVNQTTTTMIGTTMKKIHHGQGNESENGQRKEEKVVDNEERLNESIYDEDTSQATGSSNAIVNEHVDPMLNFSKIWPQQEELDQNRLPLCPNRPPGLKGNISLDMRAPPLEEIELEYEEQEAGGHWRPKNCRSRNRVAFIIPFRDREKHLRGFLHNAHRVFQRQQLDYAIFVVEQYGQNMTFNKGRLMNVGFLEAMKLYPWKCVVFHDVDTIPENDKNIYSCPTEENTAKHLGVAIDHLGYKLMYEAFIGGATVLTENQVRRANGYSNDFWGWGGEDDDFYYRVNNSGIKFWRPSQEIGRYRTFEHERDKGNKPNPCRWEMLKHTKEKQKQEGLNSVRYRLKWLTFGKLYTHIMVDVLHSEFVNFQQYLKTLKGC